MPIAQLGSKNARRRINITKNGSKTETNYIVRNTKIIPNGRQT